MVASISRRNLDAAGIALCVAGAAWTYVCSVASGGEALAVAGLFIAVGASYALARAVAARRRWLVPLFVTGLVLILAWVFRSDLPSTRPLDGPLHYTNASAALYLQGTIAALMLAALGPSRSCRIGGYVAAVALGGATLLTRSQAGDVLLVLPVIAVLCRPPERVRGLIAGLALLLVVALLFSVGLGLGYRAGPRDSTADRVVRATLSERRPALWHDALTLMAGHPLTGVGPARFQYESPVARSDPDARWAHNGFLQQGAEGGVLGLAIALAVFMWGFVRLWNKREPDAVTALGAVSLGALGVQACIDYLFHFPALPIVVAALVGVAATEASASKTPLYEESHAIDTHT